MGQSQNTSRTISLWNKKERSNERDGKKRLMITCED
jgi:hypothetical protein